MVLFVKKCLLSAIPASKVEGSHFRHRKFAENVPVQSFVQFIHPGAYQRACSCISSRRELQRGPSCKSPDSQYAATDICGSTPAVRCRRNEGTCTQTYAHKYLWQGLHCQVICTKWPYHRLNDSSTLGSQALLYQRQHRRRKIRPPAAKVQALRGARPKALLSLDFCLGIV